MKPEFTALLRTQTDERSQREAPCVKTQYFVNERPIDRTVRIMKDCEKELGL